MTVKQSHWLQLMIQFSDKLKRNSFVIGLRHQMLTKNVYYPLVLSYNALIKT